jgi:hypothetical protein
MSEQPIETGIDWEDIKQEMKSAEWQESFDDPDRLEKHVFLGTVFALYPSGKYYMPFACSNLEPCETCNGNGTITNENSDPEKLVALYTIERQLCKFVLDNYGPHFDGKWPKKLEKALRLLREELANAEPKITCPTCEGVGSEEAYLDECYREQLEQEAEEHGFYICSGEGDPCDIFAGVSAEREEVTNETGEEE